jgi:hypothetical protein
MKLEQFPHWILSLGNKMIADGKNCLVTLLNFFLFLFFLHVFLLYCIAVLVLVLLIKINIKKANSLTKS